VVVHARMGHVFVGGVGCVGVGWSVAAVTGGSGPGWVVLGLS
jgi:hypothetical protein